MLISTGTPAAKKEEVGELPGCPLLRSPCPRTGSGIGIGSSTGDPTPPHQL